jgi:hypothetical protein
MFHLFRRQGTVERGGSQPHLYLFCCDLAFLHPTPSILSGGLKGSPSGSQSRPTLSLRPSVVSVRSLSKLGSPALSPGRAVSEINMKARRIYSVPFENVSQRELQSAPYIFDQIMLASVALSFVSGHQNFERIQLGGHAPIDCPRKITL